MSELPQFVKLPSAWIDKGGLRDFRWGKNGGDEIAALIVLAVIAHHMAPATGIARLGYDALMEKASLSRAKISAGLKILVLRGIIETNVLGRGSYHLCGYDPSRNWSMFPARGLYRNDIVEAFKEFRLRRRTELDALKLYFLFAARRDNTRHVAVIGFDKIAEHSGVSTNYIKSATSVLAANSLIHVEHIKDPSGGVGVINGYRLAYLPVRKAQPSVSLPLSGGDDISF